MEELENIKQKEENKDIKDGKGNNNISDDEDEENLHFFEENKNLNKKKKATENEIDNVSGKGTLKEKQKEENSIYLKI